MELDLKAISNREIKSNEELSNEDLFPKFCFFVKTERARDSDYIHDNLIGEEIGLLLIVTDKYLSEGQIRCFEYVINHLRLKSEFYYEKKLDFDLFFSGGRATFSEHACLRRVSFKF
jgi:hypothetical protein